ncbi:MAG: bifunctional DNA-formamidopyrimidine glycosylase/DNA-(apurinic or apyrimidinic site) lyase [Planctomycetota bacterium]
MPELPEVETIRRGLEPEVIGRSFVDIRVRNSKLRLKADGTALRRALVDSKIIAVGRRSKYLMLDVDRGYTLIVHLGMSGQFQLEPGDRELRKHDHVQFLLDDGRELRFHDPRRFGLVVVRSRRTLDRDPLFCQLGPEPLAESCDHLYYFERSRGKQRNVKSFLMDSSVVVGVGNIYANEALFLASIHPTRAAGRISVERWQKLDFELRGVLSRAIKAGGTTLSDYRNATGESGRHQNALLVYGRSQQPCPRCKTSIRRIVQQQRASYYCPSCQH